MFIYVGASLQLQSSGTRERIWAMEVKEKEFEAMEVKEFDAMDEKEFYATDAWLFCVRVLSVFFVLL